MTTSARITRGMTTDAARKAVLATAELLEEILKHLPLKRLFAAQRVCRQFEIVVRSSSQLQQAMFLNWSTKKDLVWSIEPGSLANPYCGDKFVVNKDVDLSRRTPGRRHFMPVKLCSLLKPIYETSFGWVNESNVSHGVPVRLNMCKGLTQSTSWKHIFLSDPPCTIAEVRIAWNLKSKPPASGVTGFATIHDATGLTLGKVFEIMMQDSVFDYHSEGEHKWESDRTLSDVILALEAASGKRATIAKDTYIILQGVRGMTTEAARKAVLQTAELLEDILLHLSARDLFVIQRVSQQFQQIVKASHRLQQAMFLRVTTTEEQTWSVGLDVGSARVDG